MKQAMIERITAAIFDSDLIITRITLALSEAMWTLLLWWPGSIFDRPAYAGMHSVMGQHAWGLVFALSAATQASIVVLGHCGRTYARLFAAWNAVLWWYVVSALLLSTYPPPAAIAGEISIAVCAAWVWWRPILLCIWGAKALRANVETQNA